VKEVEVDRIFGETVACRPVIDSQKQGLQHAHILIFLKKTITTILVVDTQDVVDDFVCAEVPTDNPQLQNIILDQMIHGPCGAVDPNAWEESWHFFYSCYLLDLLITSAKIETLALYQASSP